MSVLRTVDGDIELYDPSDGTALLTQNGDGIEVPNGNLRLATGQSIKDGAGTDRIRFDSDFTGIDDNSGRAAFLSFNADRTEVRTYSDQPFAIADKEGGFNAVQYDTDTSAGLLRTPNAGIRVEDTASPSSGIGVEIGYNGVNGLVRTYDRDNNVNDELEIYGDPLRLHGTGGVVAIESADLRLATGQSIEDGSGNGRISLNSGNTSLGDGGSGSVGVTLSGTSGLDVQLTNGLLDLSSGGTPNLRLATGQAIEDGSGNDRFYLESSRTRIHDGGAGRVSISLSATSGSDFSVENGYTNIENGNLRLATGQSIEDGSGANRMEIDSTRTRIGDGAGNQVISLNKGNYNRIVGYSDTPIIFKDNEGYFDAVQYTTSSTAPGTLELVNADLAVDNIHDDDLGAINFWVSDVKRAELDNSGNLDLEGELTEGAAL